MTDELTRSLFAGGGDVGAAMAERDWSQTPLGPPENWPPALRNTVRILLTSRFAMWAGWGPELAFLYNDAYRHDTLQAKHPWALGRPASEVWAEIWRDIGPRVRSVLDSGVATWDEDLLLFLERRGYPEETYHTFSYSPLDDDGRTGGMLCVVTETTERVIGDRRMATLRDLSAALAPTRTRRQVLDAVGAQLARNLADLPFSAVYLYDADDTARLGVAAGIDPDGGILPAVLTAEDSRRAAQAPLRAGRPVHVDGLRARFPDLPTGAWEQAPDRAVVLPLTASGQGPEDLAGFLVVGLNPYRPQDEAYSGFLDLVAQQVSGALLNADSYEAERERAEALAELDRAKTDFFSNVSHEFRTPLTLIMGPVAELRAAEDLSAPRVREELEVIERNALRLGKLVNTLLDFSRLQAGRIEARFEPVDLAATTAELASVFRSAVARAGLSYDVACAALPEPVHVDRDMWEKVVLNLLSNALKFTFEGGITVRLEPGSEAAVLTVADTGTGIPAGELPRLFERFTRVAGARSRSGEGSGIGLAMVRELVGLHGGTVTAQSTVGAGTTFTVTVPYGTAHLPADQLAPPTPDAPAVGRAAAPFLSEALRWLPPAADAAETPGEPGDAGSAGAGPAGRVLVADDNADMRDYLLRLLTPRYAVTAVADGQEALEAARAAPPDLLVSDVMMPRLDGMALLAELRTDPRTSRVPVLLLSARAGEEAAVEGLAAGADDYLVKPFAAQELLARVGAHVHLGRARREAEERFTAIADLAPALIWVSDREGRRVLVNAGWTAFTGRDAGAELGDGWRDGVHPDDRERLAQAVAEATDGDRGWEVEFRLRRADGTYAWLLERAVPIGAGLGSAGHVGVCTDISVRHRETERQALLAAAGAVLDTERTVDGQLSALSRLLVDRRVADICTARVVGDDGQLRFAGIAGLDAGAEAAVATLGPHSGLGPDVVRSGRSVLTAQLPWPPEGRPELAGTLAVGSGMAVPLSVGGRVLAVLGLARGAQAQPFGEDDRLLVEEVAARAALAVDNVLLLAGEQATARRLAVLQRVTAEVSAATTPEEVAEVAARALSGLTGDGGRTGVYELDATGRSLEALAMSGRDSRWAADRRAWASVPLSAPVALSAAVSTGRAVWVEDVAPRPIGRACRLPSPTASCRTLWPRRQRCRSPWAGG
ncbi:ATP-binding protein [Trujillonella humicola]|uniref:ATP-binding protein n=1 Tax=Trujillonella humicola TaxID=3383699 RepID=UPI003906B490